MTEDLASRHIWVTILAGGVGSRFWPVSTPARPKQLLPLGSDRPLIVDTVERALRVVPPERLRILAGEHLVSPFRQAVPDLPDGCYLVEPMARGTGPVLAWAAQKIAAADPDGVMVSLHSDHVIRPPDSFVRTLRDGAALAARESCLFTVCARPDRPETGYGYIRPGAPIPDTGDLHAFRVQAFIEKPDLETARRYVEEGYRWNTGIFIWPARVFLEQVRTHAPEIGDHLHLVADGRDGEFFRACPSISVDEAVLERSAGVSSIEAPFHWDDVGSWEALTRTREDDGTGNTLVGNALVREGEGNIVFSEEGSVVLWGVDDLVVVRTGDTTVVLPRDRAPDLKRLVQDLPPELRSPDHD